MLAIYTDTLPLRSNHDEREFLDLIQAAEDAGLKWMQIPVLVQDPAVENPNEAALVESTLTVRLASIRSFGEL